MITATVMIEQQIARKMCASLVEAIAYIRELTGEEIRVDRVHSDVMSGAGLCMHIRGCFVSIARLQ